MGHTVLVDEAFVQPPEHRPKTVVSEADSIPLIDLLPLYSNSAGTALPETLVAQVEAACRDWGFFQVINHGVPPELLRKAEAAMREFFALSDEEKRKVRQDEVNALGYYESELTKNVRDWKEVFDIIAHEQDEIDVAGLVLRNKWPQVPLGFRETFEEFAKSMEKLAFELLELIALSLHLPPKKFNIFFEQANSLLRLNHYPPCPNPDLVLGVGRHKDPGALTVLYQDSTGGLDVKRRSDGEWFRVKPIPDAFIINVGDVFQAPEHRPKPIISEAGSIPLIDLSSLFSEGADMVVPTTLVEQVETASRDWGFFQVINHGITPELLKAAETAEREFFALSGEEKKKVRRDEVNPLGFYESEHTKNVRDWKEVFDMVVHEPSELDVRGLELRNKWPQVPIGFRETFEEYAKSVEKLAFTLLELIALSLNLPAKRLNVFFEEQTSFIRLNHYPPCPYPDLALGVGRHKDAGALTVLYQDSTGGLDVKRKSDGEWVRVKPIPNAFIINVGDIIQVWSNDKYESAEHRVSVNSAKDRYSIPFFFNPASHTNVKPLEELVDERNRAKYDEYNWGEFFKTRKDSNYKKLEVENIQITHFKRV